MKRHKIVFSIIGTIILVLATMALVIYFEHQKMPEITGELAHVSIVIDYGKLKIPQEEVYNITVKSGTTAYDAFNEVVDLQTKNYSFGMFIEGVNGYVATPPDYWAFYYRQYCDETWIYAEIGVTTYKIKDGDMLKLAYTSG